MKRTKIQELIDWKGSDARKPLIIRGARQVGKTWLMKEFGRTAYRQFAYFNFEKARRLRPLFTDDFDIQRILTALQLESGLTIRPDDTLLIFDEIQEIPEAITALKYFCEDASEYHVLAAGSLLGAVSHSGISFPVGKVSFMDLHPLTFSEFLDATGENALLEILGRGDWKLINLYKSRFTERLRQYYFVGGMPEVVATFVEKNNFRDVRNIQQAILIAYEQDFSRHPPNELVPRIRMAWNSIPGQPFL